MDRRGQKVLVHAPMRDWYGRIVAETERSVTLDEAWWIPYLGDYVRASTEGTFEEMYPVPGKVTVYTGPGVVIIEWPHLLPSTK